MISHLSSGEMQSSEKQETQLTRIDLVASQKEKKACEIWLMSKLDSDRRPSKMRQGIGEFLVDTFLPSNVRVGRHSSMVV
jgi:hypothetical protein